MLILLQNHIATAIRHILKNKVFSFITIFALSTSIAACLLIFQYTTFELSFDKFYPNAADIYRVNLRTYVNGELRSESALSPFNLAEVQRNVQGIDSFTEFGTTQWWFNCSFTYRDGNTSRTFNENHVAYTTPAAINIFDLHLTSGSGGKALVEPFTMIISESAAIKYFGDEDPIGKVLHFRGSADTHDYTVTGVMEDQPKNSHYRNEILLSFSSWDLDKYRKMYSTYGYIMLNRLASPTDVQKRLTAFAGQQPAPENTRYDIFLEPVTDIHLYSTAEDQFNSAKDVTFIFFLMGIAFVVLALAWINYVNLSIARSFARAKEVGVRKTAGATQRHIANQFLSESLVYNLISIVIAIIIVAISAPWFYDFVGIKFPWDKIYWTNLGPTAWIVAGIFLSGLLISGYLPARLMAAIPTIKVLKGKFTGIKNNALLRRSSVVFQFACAIALLMAVVTFNRQFNVMKETNTNIDFKRSLIVLSPSNADSSFRTRLSQLRSVLQNHSIADKVFTAGLVFEISDGWTAGVSREQNDERQMYYVNIIDPGFIEGYGLKLIAGRNFQTTDYPGEKFFDKVEPVILNKTGALRLGFTRPEDAIEATIHWDGNRCRVIGVIDDYYQRSTKIPLGPAIYTANDGSLLNIQLSASAMGENFKETIATIKAEWDKFFPDNAFEYFMLADHYDSLYSDERQLKNVFGFFGALAILISCLGLFALSLFSVNQRAKEMSIRKVLGAPSKHLVHLLTREYVLMVTIAGIIAIPFASWAIEEWLTTFALRVQIDASNIVTPVALVLAFALLSIAIQTFRVVTGNPTRNLKVE
ncbi:MAG TPA: ABC transporter permease [Cyclobacteriaceae bacterium]|nr:ABC transporter permease [Cyclobacteriaceae bacterium]